MRHNYFTVPYIDKRAVIRGGASIAAIIRARHPGASLVEILHPRDGGVPGTVAPVVTFGDGRGHTGKRERRGSALPVSLRVPDPGDRYRDSVGPAEAPARWKPPSRR